MGYRVFAAAALLLTLAGCVNEPAPRAAPPMALASADTVRLQFASRYDGVWTGDLYQHSVGLRLPTKATLSYVQGVHKIDYPTMQCGGELIARGPIISPMPVEMIPQALDQPLDFQLRMWYGPAACVTNARLVLDLDPKGQMTVQYYSPTGDLTATGTFSRN